MARTRGPSCRSRSRTRLRRPAFNLTALSNAFKHHADGSGVFESGQDPIIVGQAAYNSAYGKTFVASGDCTNPTGTQQVRRAGPHQPAGRQTVPASTPSRAPQLKVPQIEPKALHDEMNSADLRRVRPDDGQPRPRGRPATPAGQNILLYPYIAPPTEVIDGTNLPTG